MSKERNVLSQILKSWAGEHDAAYQIASPEPGDEGVDTTAMSLSWVIKQTNANIDLVTLLDRLELYINNIKNKTYPDGMFCCNCQTFYQYAEPNQPDGTLLCYSCRANPYT
jgi:hypothetical protein